MDFIIADDKRMEIGYLPKEVEIDLTLYRDADNACGKNDAKIKVSGASMIGYGTFVFVPGTEYGGRILELQRKTSEKAEEWYLDTWRRMLGQKIIVPPAGQAYRSASGDANDEIRKILGGMFGDLFVVPSAPAGITVSGQYDRYTSVLDGLNKILLRSNAKLQIKAMQGEPNKKFYVQIGAVPIADYSQDIEYSQDNKIDLTIRDCRRGINHLICLGRGELTERMIRHLYVQEDGTIGGTQYYFDTDCREVAFDYPNAENEEELVKAGRERLQELMNYKKMEVSVNDLTLDIGDIVAGRDRVSGMYLSKPIVSKILRVKNGVESIRHEVKGDD